MTSFDTHSNFKKDSTGSPALAYKSLSHLTFNSFSSGEYPMIPLAPKSRPHSTLILLNQEEFNSESNSRKNPLVPVHRTARDSPA